MAVIGQTITSTSPPSPLAAPLGIAGAPATMYFPSDLGGTKFNYWMSFSFYQYFPQTFTGSTTLTEQSTLRLPLPNSMLDQQDVDWQTESLGLATGMLMNMAAQQGAGAMGQAGAMAAGIAGTKVSDAAGLSAGLSAFTPALQPLGVTINPYMTVMFKSPAFKRHDFSWQLAPVSPAESITLNAIINTFRMNQLPGTAGSAALLTYPSIVYIVISNNDPNNFTYIFKPAVITMFSVNWAPGGQPSFFGSTQAPSIVEVRMSLMEIEFWLNSDYSGQVGAVPNVPEVVQKLLSNITLPSYSLTGQ